MGKERWVGAAILALALAPYFISIPALDGIHNRSLDLYQRVIPRQIQPEENRVVIVDLDAEFIIVNGQWPLPRNIFANLVENIGKAGAKVIVFDVVFGQPDKKGKLVSSDDEIKNLALTPIERKRLVDTDLSFARAIAKWPVVLGVEPEFVENEQIKTLNKKQSVSVVNDYGFSWLIKAPQLYQNYSLFSRHARGLGAMALYSNEVQNNGKSPVSISGIYTALAYGDNALPALAAESVRIYLGEKTYSVYGDWYGIFETNFYSIPRVKTDRDGAIWVHFTKFGSDRYIPAGSIVDGTFDAAFLKDKIVFIGTSVDALDPVRQIPTGKIVPGVEIHAQAAEAILVGGILSNSITETIIEVSVLLVAALLVIVVMPLMSINLSLGTLLISEIFMVGSGWVLFIWQQRLVDMLYPALILFIIVFIMLGVRKFFRHPV